MLGFIQKKGQGDGDRTLASVAVTLSSRGFVLAGVIQINYVFDPERRCHMDLQVLGDGPTVRISQDRGRFAQGCRLDPEGLAHAVALVDATLERGEVDLLIVNKFGKAELEGGGFREVIGKALIAGVPALTTVSPAHLSEILGYAGELGAKLHADHDEVVAWCLAQRETAMNAGAE